MPPHGGAPSWEPPGGILVFGGNKMKKKLLVVFLICCMMFGVASPAFALGETWYDDAQTYIQIDENSRLVQVHMQSVYNGPFYIVDHGDSLEFVIPNITLALNFVAHSDGTYTLNGLNGFEDVENKYGFNKVQSLTLSYPFSIGGVAFNSKADFIQKCQGSQGVYSLPADATGGADDAGDSFFQDPLLETVKNLQKGTTMIPESLRDSYLVYLVPLGISCLALLISLPVLSKVLRKFLG